jgi:hypothetical protein
MSVELSPFADRTVVRSARRLAGKVLGSSTRNAGPLATAAVVGVGLLAPPDDPKQMHPLLLAEGDGPDVPTLFWDSKIADAFLEQSLLEKEDIPNDLIVMGVPTPQYFAGPGDGIECLGRFGTLGALVTTRFGSPGILTAGHVAGPVGAPVTSASDDVGVVIFSEDPGDAPVMALSVDIAVIATRDLKPQYLGIPPIVDTITPSSNEVVTIYGRSRLSSTIQGYCFYVKIGRGLAADVWMTSQSISRAGDSGAPVLVSNSETEDFAFILGHVIGGAEGVTTFIQDIHTQLAVARVQLMLP